MLTTDTTDTTDTTEGSSSRAWASRRLGLTAAVAAALTLATGVGAVAAARPAPSASSATRAQTSAASAVPVALRSATLGAGRVSLARLPARPASTALTARSGPSAANAAKAALTTSDRQRCPATATACVDLTRHVTWLQTDGKVSFGPVAMEPGQPGSKHTTPRGTFHVSWKAGPRFVSDIYHEKMPWATFFAAGGIAFHGGSLTQWSHGCVHLSVANAHHYQQNLPIGAEVVVF